MQDQRQGAYREPRIRRKVRIGTLRIRVFLWIRGSSPRQPGARLTVQDQRQVALSSRPKRRQIQR